LRGAPSFAFERLALTGFAPRSPVREALERQISQLPLKLVSVAQAQVVLEVLREKQFRVAVASTPVVCTLLPGHCNALKRSLAGSRSAQVLPA
jgi:hypothetical protein